MAMATQQRLKTNIPADKYNNFLKFRKILKTFEKSEITKKELDEIHQQIIDFSKDFEKVYGKQKVMANQHYHFHLAECIERYGPVSCFWAFNFERYNMFVKNIKTNHKDGVEKTLMKKMLHQIFSTDYFRNLQKK